VSSRHAACGDSRGSAASPPAALQGLPVSGQDQFPEQGTQSLPACRQKSALPRTRLPGSRQAVRSAA